VYAETQLYLNNNQANALYKVTKCCPCSSSLLIAEVGTMQLAHASVGLRARKRIVLLHLAMRHFSI